MHTITYGDAISEAICEEMRRESHLFMMGEDVEKGGGYLQGLTQEFGVERVFDTPISEAGIIGAAVGAACTGCRVIVHLAPFGEFIIIGMDQIYNQAAKFRYMFGGKPKVPMVIRTAIGGYISAAEHHSQCLESWFAHAPGLIVATPATPRDVKGMLKTAIRNDNPVIFFEHKLLYGLKGEVPDEEYLTPFGQADVKREGTDVTVISYSYMVQKVLAVAERLAPEVSVEVVDIRTLTPLDEETIVASVEKTHRAVVVHETWSHGGFGGEIAARVADKAFYSLDAPIKRVGAKHFPIPFAPELENYVLPQEADIESAIREVTK
jgi:pyruvate/2-oxoglutarate/acetoin dehydrogenase E1 component